MGRGGEHLPSNDSQMKLTCHFRGPRIYFKIRQQAFNPIILRSVQKLRNKLSTIQYHIIVDVAIYQDKCTQVKEYHTNFCFQQQERCLFHVLRSWLKAQVSGLLFAEPQVCKRPRELLKLKPQARKFVQTSPSQRASAAFHSHHCQEFLFPLGIHGLFLGIPNVRR